MGGMQFDGKTYLLTGHEDKRNTQSEDKRIGYVGKDEAEEEVEPKEGYIYGTIADFLVYNSDKAYLTVYSLKETDYPEKVAYEILDWLMIYTRQDLVKETDTSFSSDPT